MLVELKNDWYAPNGRLYLKTQNPHTILDKYEKFLPSTAKKVKAKSAEEEEEELEAEQTADETPLAGQAHKSKR